VRSHTYIMILKLECSGDILMKLYKEFHYEHRKQITIFVRVYEI